MTFPARTTANIGAPSSSAIATRPSPWPIRSSCAKNPACTPTPRRWSRRTTRPLWSATRPPTRSRKCTGNERERTCRRGRAFLRGRGTRFLTCREITLGCTSATRPTRWARLWRRWICMLCVSGEFTYNILHICSELFIFKEILLFKICTTWGLTLQCKVSARILNLKFLSRQDVLELFKFYKNTFCRLLIKILIKNQILKIPKIKFYLL